MKVGDVVQLTSSSGLYTHYIGCYGIIIKLYVEDDDDVIGINIAIRAMLLKPINEEFSNKLRIEFANYMMNCITRNPLISIGTVLADTKNIKKE